MGLDMYLEASRYVSDWKHNLTVGDAEAEMYRSICKYLGVDRLEESPGGRVTLNIGYWRKANAIHNWFVTNCQNGVDNCEPSRVEWEQLEALKADCIMALAALEDDRVEQAAAILVPTGGFFFGSTEVNEDYKRELQRTIEIVDRALSMDGLTEFYYQASW